MELRLLKSMTYLKLYLFAALAFFPLDMIWLGWIGRPIYNRQIGHLMAEQVDWAAAGIFYSIFLAGLLYFVVVPTLNGTSGEVLLRGALFGVITYATYEFTNKAVLATWPWPIVIVDVLWGAVLCAITAWVSWRFGR
ncbi:MAG: DUF2177 family protein [Bacteroidota bacterium]